jgi:FtsP/CotA-like multicopper oxidase with cupredoxin domain
MKTSRVALALTRLLIATALVPVAGCGDDDTIVVAPSDERFLGPYPRTGTTRTFQLTITEDEPWEVALGAIYDATMYNGAIPGPTIDVMAGDHVVVELTNHGTEPYSVHTHISEFDEANDGSHGSLTAPGETRTYEWDALYPGTFPYHDHGLHEYEEGSTHDYDGLTRGLFGAVIVRAPDEAPANEHLVVLADFATSNYLSLPGVADPETGEFPPGDYRGGHGYMHTINGRAYEDFVTPFTGKVGELQRWRVVSLGHEFHTWHIHGHRWLDTDGTLTDNVLLGPAQAKTFEFLEDSPGHWLVHCHVPDHMEGGMIAEYIVDAAH